MTVNVELELTAYLLGIDYGRHIVSSFIEQCQYSLVNIVVDKDKKIQSELYAYCSRYFWA